MAVTLNSRINLMISALLADAIDLATVRADLEKSYTVDIPTGATAGLADAVFHDQRTVASGATDSLDLAGVLTDALGRALSFASIKAVLIKAASGNSTVLSVTRPASNGVPLFAAANDACPVGPNGWFFWGSPGAGVTVTADTGDLLNIVNASGAAATYDVIIIGVKA